MCLRLARYFCDTMIVQWTALMEMHYVPPSFAPLCLQHYSASTCKVQVRNFEANVADCFEVGDEDSDMCKPFTNAINTFQMEPYL